MDQTTRALAVLAAATLILAPLVNGVLEEAAATADRIFLKDTDWTGDPPEDPPDQPPPEDLDANQQEGNLTGQAGGASCTPERRLVAAWQHDAYTKDPLTAAQNRTSQPSPQTFEVSEDDIGLGIAFDALNVSGTLSASVHQDDQDTDNAPWSVDKQQPLEEDIHNPGKITPPTLSAGTWVAELQHEGAHYDELTFLVFAFSCQEASS